MVGGRRRSRSRGLSINPKEWYPSLRGEEGTGFRSRHPGFGARHPLRFRPLFRFPKQERYSQPDARPWSLACRCWCRSSFVCRADTWEELATELAAVKKAQLKIELQMIERSSNNNNTGNVAVSDFTSDPIAAISSASGTSEKVHVFVDAAAPPEMPAFTIPLSSELEVFLVAVAVVWVHMILGSSNRMPSSEAFLKSPFLLL